MHANTQERECVLFNKSIKWTSQVVANMYAELVGPPYSLEGREGMRKGQFQQLMHQIKVPMPRTGPFSSTMNDRLFHMFDKRKSARVSLEDLLHGLHVLSGDSKKDKLALAFKAFDMGNRGVVTLGDMAAAIKDITNILYVGQKIPTPERVKVFATGVMAQYNDDKEEEAAYVLSAEQFVASAMDSAQIANLFSLGSISADDAKSAAADAEDHEGNAAEEPAPAPSKRAAPTEAAKPKPTAPAGNAAAADVGMRGMGRAAPAAGRGMPPPAGRGGMAGRGAQLQQPPHGPRAAGGPHHDSEAAVPHARAADAGEVRMRRRSSGEKDSREKRKSGSSEGGKPTGPAAAPAAASISPRGPKPSQAPPTTSEKAPARKESAGRTEPGEGTETMEEMNARLVAHIRALQSELRKYMDFDKDNKQEVEQLNSQVQELTAENTQLKAQLKRTSQGSKQLVKEKEKEKVLDQKARALTKKVGEMENEIAKQRDMEKEFAGVLQFLVGPPIEQKVATTLQDVRVLKCSSMVKRGGLIKSWKRRMFILRENMQLIYYAADERPQPRGVLDLRTVVVVRVPKDAPPNVLEIITNSRQWFIACDSEDEAQEWCKLLNHMVETNKLRPAVGADRFLPNIFS